MTSSFFYPYAPLEFSDVVIIFREHVEGLGNGVIVELLCFIGRYRSRWLSNCRKQPDPLEHQSFSMIEEPKASAFLRPLNRTIVTNRRVGNTLADPGELNQLHHHFFQNGRKFN